jgi:hypothetical protein
MITANTIEQMIAITVLLRSHGQAFTAEYATGRNQWEITLL